MALALEHDERLAQLKQSAMRVLDCSFLSAMPMLKATFSLVNWRDVGNRAVKTFVQAAVGYVVAAITKVDIFHSDQSFWMGLLVSTIAAGASAAWNGVLKPVLVTVRDRWKG